jgi:ketosteroid isomerase-like protein
VSAENIATVRRAVEALNRHDVESALESVHKDVVFDWGASNAPWAGVYEGPDEALGRFQEFFEAWENVQWELEDIFEVPPHYVIAVTRVTSQGRSGLQTGARGAWVWTFRGDKASRVKLCQTREEALAAVESDERPD